MKSQSLSLGPRNMHLTIPQILSLKVEDHESSVRTERKIKLNIKQENSRLLSAT